MAKPRVVKPMFRLSPVDFRDSAIAGRGVFARRAFAPGEVVVAYAPRQRRVPVDAPEAAAAAQSKLTLLSEERFVIVPDTSVPGGWLCNHSCDPNAAIYSDGPGRIQCTRPIAPGEEVTIFYGWVSQNDPRRDPCLCGSPQCRGFINFDVSDDDARRVRVVDGNRVAVDDALARRLADYADFLRSIGQEQVEQVIVNTLVRMRQRPSP